LPTYRAAVDTSFSFLEPYTCAFTAEYVAARQLNRKLGVFVVFGGVIRLLAYGAF